MADEQTSKPAAAPAGTAPVMSPATPETATPKAAQATAAAPSAAKPATPVAPPAPPVPNPVPEIPLPFKGVDFQAKGFHAEAVIEPAEVVSAAKAMDAAGFAMDTITGVDWMAENQMEVIYDFFHPTRNLRAAIRARISRENPEIATISKVFPGANWHERETHDFFGIRFAGHPNLEPFLLPEDSTFHPLRKDFQS